MSSPYFREIVNFGDGKKRVAVGGFGKGTQILKVVLGCKAGLFCRVMCGTNE